MAVVISSEWDPAEPFVLRFFAVDQTFSGDEAKAQEMAAGAVVEYRAGNQWIVLPTEITLHPPVIRVTFPPELAGSSPSIRLNTPKGQFGPIVWYFPVAG